MWLSELIAAIIGLSGGMVVATALAAFIIGLVLSRGMQVLPIQDIICSSTRTL